MTIGKRAFDLLAALFGLTILFPLFLGVAAAILLDDGRPVFFRQARVGRGGRLFRLWKFRTMVCGAEKLGGPLTVGSDSRVTRLGSWLRRWKIDELPQLMNVVTGAMSIVGPRPEVVRYVERYSPAERAVLDLVPGITDPASIRFRDEAALLGGREDAEAYYVGTVMPEKILMNLQYASTATRMSDLKLVIDTLWQVVFVRRPGDIAKHATRGLVP